MLNFKKPLVDLSDKHEHFYSLINFLMCSMSLFKLSSPDGSLVTLLTFAFCFVCAVVCSWSQMKQKETKRSIVNLQEIRELTATYRRRLSVLHEQALSETKEEVEEIDNSLYITDKRLLRKLDETNN